MTRLEFICNESINELIFKMQFIDKVLNSLREPEELILEFSKHKMFNEIPYDELKEAIVYDVKEYLKSKKLRAQSTKLEIFKLTEIRIYQQMMLETLQYQNNNFLII